MLFRVGSEIMNAMKSSSCVKPATHAMRNVSVAHHEIISGENANDKLSRIGAITTEKKATPKSTTGAELKRAITE